MNKSKAPDTRGKLESVKVPKAKKKKAAKKKNFKELAMDLTPQVIKGKITPKKTKGQIFKETHGYSKSIARAMRRAGVTSLEAYKAVRSKRKYKLKKLQQDKHSLARANRIAKRATSKKK